MSFSLEDLDLILGDAGILSAEQYQQVRDLLERTLAESNAPAAAAAAATLSSSVPSPFPLCTATESDPSDDQEMSEATVEVDGQEQEQEDGDMPMEGAAENVASTTADGGTAPVVTAMVTTVVPVGGSAPLPVAPAAAAAAAAANTVPVVLPAVHTNLPIQTRFLGMANILTADIILPPVGLQAVGVNFTPIARASTQPPAAITDDAIAQQFCRMWSLQFTARDTRRRANEANLVYKFHGDDMDAIAAATYAALFQRTGGPSGIHGWPQMTDLVTTMGYKILRILYDHRHALAPGEFHAHAIALDLANSRNSPKNLEGVLVHAMFTAAGFP